MTLNKIDADLLHIDWNEGIERIVLPEPEESSVLADDQSAVTGSEGFLSGQYPLLIRSDSFRGRGS